MRIVFAGTPSPALDSLEALRRDHDVALVVTRPDAPIGRRRVLTPSPVAELAEGSGLPVLKTARLDDDATRAVGEVRADLGVVVAYGGIVREPLLSSPRLGWINLHFSLLPRWRGAAPVQHALMAGDTVTGVSVFRLVPELDAGDLYARVEHPIGPDITSGELLVELAALGAGVLADTVRALESSAARPVRQSAAVTLAPKLSGADGRLDPTSGIGSVYDRFRAVTPEPGAYVQLDDGRLKILAAARHDGPAPEPGRFAAGDGRVLLGVGSGALLLKRVQPSGRRAMPAADWWRGVGTREPVAR